MVWVAKDEVVPKGNSPPETPLERLPRSGVCEATSEATPASALDSAASPAQEAESSRLRAEDGGSAGCSTVGATSVSATRVARPLQGNLATAIAEVELALADALAVARDDPDADEESVLDLEDTVKLAVFAKSTV